MRTAVAPRSAQLHRVEFRAMGSGIGMWLLSDNAEAADSRLGAAWAFMRLIELQLSRFLPDSELSLLNGRHGLPTRVSPALWQAIGVALDAARHTDGLYDPTVIDALEAAGYTHSFAEGLDTDAPVGQVTPPKAGWRDIRLEERTRMVTLPPGVRIDLGGSAKAWAAERAADMLASLGPCLVDAGGDIAARGTPPDSEAGWPIGVADPHQPDIDLCMLRICNRGVATSGVDYRRWRRGASVQHHIIDPRTRRPADTDLWTVTVVAQNVVEADMHAKVALLLGSEEGYRYIERQADVEALLVREDGRLTTSGFSRHVHGIVQR